VTEHHVSAIPREARPFQGRPAGLVTRFAASVLDSLVVGFLLLLGFASLNVLRFMIDPRGFTLLDTSAVLVLGVAIPLAVVYLAATWALTGRSYGCHVMGLRVVDRRRRKPGPLLALLRAGFCVLFPLGLVWCAFTRGRSSVQDIVLRTSVVYDWRPREDADAG
jgi:uncharacterized RDD family membrane protein YckC